VTRKEQLPKLPNKHFSNQLFQERGKSESGILPFSAFFLFLIEICPRCCRAALLLFGFFPYFF